MTVKLDERNMKRIELKLQEGEFKSVDELIAASLDALDENSVGEFAPGELDRLLDEGEASGTPIPAQEVHARIDAKLKSLREQSAMSSGS